MTVPDLVIRYQQAFGKPPRVKHRDWLWRRVAWKIQEQRFGGLSTVAMRRLDELIGELDLPLTDIRIARGTVRSRGSVGGTAVGTVIVREWRGEEIHATRTIDGWEHEGVVYRSLSAVVKAVTGSHASGPAWFGLKKNMKRAAQ